MANSYNLSYSHFQEDDSLVISIDIIRKRLILLMKYHIGIENSISITEIFEYVMGKKSATMNIYQKVFWWGTIKKIMRDLRADGSLFTIRRGKKYFVLHDKAELEHFRKTTEKHISNLNCLMKKAEEWVNERKFDFKQDKNGI